MALSAVALDLRTTMVPSLDCLQLGAGSISQLRVPHCVVSQSFTQEVRTSCTYSCQAVPKSCRTVERRIGFVDRSDSVVFRRQTRRRDFSILATGDAEGANDGDLARQLAQPEAGSKPVKEVDSGERVDTELKLKRQSQISVQFGRHYEIMYLISEKELENVPRIIEWYRGCIEKNGGIVWRLNDWGVRRLAYRIKKQRRANYVLMNFECIPGLMVAMDKVMKQDPRIIRHLIMKQKRAITKPHPPPPEYRPPEIGSLLQKDDEGNIIALQDEDEWDEYEEFEEYEEFDEGGEFEDDEEGEFLFEEEDVGSETGGETDSESSLAGAKQVGDDLRPDRKQI